MKKPKILRRRYIPYETVDISSDEVLYRSDDLLITKWTAIRPRTDFCRGISYTFLNDGFKVGRFYNADGEFLYWYCDIIDVEYRKDGDTYVLIDLLVDIKLMTDGAVRVIDTGELAEAMEGGLITTEQACRALRKLDNVLNMIYEGKFPPEVCKKKEYWL